MLFAVTLILNCLLSKIFFLNVSLSFSACFRVDFRALKSSCRIDGKTPLPSGNCAHRHTLCPVNTLTAALAPYFFHANTSYSISTY